MLPTTRYYCNCPLGHLKKCHFCILQSNSRQIKPGTEFQAQKGIYFMNFLEAFSSYGLIKSASSVSFMIRDAVALLCGSIPKRSRKDELDI